jgi:hypothetical protein
MNINIEVSDTDGHEPMGTYVRKFTMSIPEDLGVHAIGRRVKKEIGWRGRHSTLVIDRRTIKIYSSDTSEICTITFEEGDFEWSKEISGAS